MIMCKFIKEENQGISFWEAIGYLLWYSLVIGVIVQIPCLIVGSIFHLDKHVVIYPYYELFTEVIRDIGIIAMFIAKLKKRE